MTRTNRKIEIATEEIPEPESPEKNLFTAIISRAIFDYIQFYKYKDDFRPMAETHYKNDGFKNLSEVFYSAKDYLFDEENDCDFSFVDLSEVLCPSAHQVFRKTIRAFCEISKGKRIDFREFPTNKDGLLKFLVNNSKD